MKKKIDPEVDFIIDKSGRMPPIKVLYFVGGAIFFTACIYILFSGRLTNALSDRLSTGTYKLEHSDFVAAETYFKQGLELVPPGTPKNDIYRANVFSGLAKAELHQGKLTEAEKQIQEAIDIRNKVPAHEYPTSAKQKEIEFYSNTKEDMNKCLSIRKEILQSAGKSDVHQKMTGN